MKELKRENERENRLFNTVREINLFNIFFYYYLILNEKLSAI